MDRFGFFFGTGVCRSDDDTVDLCEPGTLFCFFLSGGVWGGFLLLLLLLLLLRTVAGYACRSRGFRV